MTKALHIGKGLSLPPDAVTSTGVIYGGKGMGKTNLGSVLVEECAAAGLRFSVIDPMGVWWGLRFDVSGKGPGIEVLILGGVHGDIPIEPTSGAVVADLVADEDVSVVIDVSRRPDGSMWSIAERIRFVTDYCKRLYQRQGEKRRPLLQVIDEAARFAPQMVRHGEGEVAACMGAVAVLVEEGRNVGLGCWLITQRSARLNKDVAELADCMIAFRTVGPNSMGAVLDWLGEHVEKKRLKELSEKLRALPRGTALVVSPGWLEVEAVVQMRARETFDSSATPKPGQAVKKVSGGAKPDLSKYAARMKETIERAKASDPRALRKRVVELEAQVKKLEAAKAPKEKLVQVAKADPRLGALVKKLQKAVEQAMKFIVTINTEGFFKAGGDAVDKAQVQKAIEAAVANVMKMLEQKVEQRNRDIDKLRAEASKVLTQLKALTLEDINVEVAVKHNEPFTVTPRPKAPTATVHSPAPANGEISAYARSLVDTIARRHPMALTRAQISTLSGRSPRSSSFDGAISALIKAGLLVKDRELYLLSESGLQLAGAVAGQPQSPDEVRAQWRRALPAYEALFFDTLVKAYPQAMTREQLAEQTGKSITSSSFDGAISSLRKNGLVTVDRGEIRASDSLFMEAAS